MTRQDVIEILDDAIRQGEEKDEPEGARYIMLSDTLAKQMSNALRMVTEIER